MGEKYYDIAKESVVFSLMVIDFYSIREKNLQHPSVSDIFDLED